MRITLPSGTHAEIAGTGSDRGLVVAPDIFGLRPLYDDMVAGFARDWGVIACAPEPFPSQQLGTELDGRYAAVPGLDDAHHLDDLLFAADATGCEEVSLIGFCMGGMYAFKAARSDRFRRICAFYGMIRLPEPWHGPGQREPLDCLAVGHPERVLAIIGGVDPYTPAPDVEALRAAGVTVVEYPEGDHGFAHDAARPAHRAEDAADAFARAKAWFDY